MSNGPGLAKTIPPIVHMLRHGLNDVCATIEKLESENARLAHENGELLDAVARMRAALQPFAKVGDDFDSWKDDASVVPERSIVFENDELGSKITLAEFFRASEALR